MPSNFFSSRGLVGLVVAAFCAAVPAAACAGQANVTISTVGETQFKVPDGVTSIQFEATGARGGNDLVGISTGGLGGRAVGTVSGVGVNPGRIFYVEVGIGGGAGGNFNGGAGGGASDLRTCSAVNVGPTCAGNFTSLATRLLVGAGGGGGGTGNGGNGGAAGVAGADGDNFFPFGHGGGPGTPSAGGAGGAGSSDGGSAGSAGVLGAGGAGGTVSGGGGGAGLYGGGGGGGKLTANENSGGGGGGSSFVDGSLSATGTGPAQQDAPKMVISYQESVAPLLSIGAPSNGSRRPPTPVVSGIGGTDSGDAGTVTVRVYAGAAASGTPVRSVVADVNPVNGAWSTQVTDPLPDGQYTLRGEQSDAAQNTGMSTPVTITVDGTAPALTLSSPAAATPDPTAPIAGTAGVASGDTASVGLAIFAGSSAAGSPVESLGATPGPGGAFSATPSPPLAEGTYTVRATQADDVGNQASATRTFVVDTTAPTVAVSTPADGATYPEGATIAADYSCADGGSGIAACDAPVATGTAIDTAALGAHAFTVTAHDSAGNTAERTVSYTVSAVAPAATTGAASGVSASAATLAGSVVPHASGATARVDYGTSTAYGKSAAAGSLAPGGASMPVSTKVTGLKPGVTYHYRVVATSSAGIGAGADRTFTTTRLAAGLKLRSLRVRGAFLTITGVAASGVTGTVKATAKRNGHSTKGQTKLRRGRFTLRVAVPRGSGRVAVTVSYAGDARHRKATAKRRVAAAAR